MSLALRVYEAFKDDETKARVLSEVLDEIESNFLHQKDALNQEDLNKVNYSLLLEIEKVRKEIKEVEGSLILEIKEAESRLALEIEKIRNEAKGAESRLALKTKEVESNLSLKTKEVESNLSLEIKEVESSLSLKIKEVEGRLAIEIEKVRREVEKVKTELMKHMNRHLIWMIGSISIVIGALKALDYILK